MRVLVACEESQAVTIEFRKLGVEAYSCDILPCSGGHPEWHIKDDVLKHLWSEKWDIVIAFPPCTLLANSGVRWLYSKKTGFNKERVEKLKEAAKFFRNFVFYGKLGNKISIENPIMHKYAKEEIFLSDSGKPTQIIQPWQFGHGETKATCLWLKGLPKLTPTDIVEGREQRIWKLPPSEDRAKLRSKTFPGIAKAMATQWTNYLKLNL